MAKDELTPEVDEARVDYALRRVIERLDYDLHKSLECDEEGGEDTYPEWVDVFVEAYKEGPGATVGD